MYKNQYPFIASEDKWAPFSHLPDAPKKGLDTLLYVSYFEQAIELRT